VIYDAAHAFGVRYKDKPVPNYGDVSMLSFHATKLFTTGEGGALICKSETQKKRIESLKNFGIADEENVIGPGINGKMSEFQAAFGLLQLETVEQEIENRGRLSGIYKAELGDVPSITFLEEMPDVSHNYAYFPILVDEELFGVSRDDLYTLLKAFNVFTRKYFYPLCSHYSCYSPLPSSAPENLPVAERVSRQVLCLPIYGGMKAKTAARIATIIKEICAAQ
jgi:dTDP-4-amino-4,6-dideoxygalactose transaminase